MAVGNIAKKMLGYADEFIEGATKGVGDGRVIRNSVNRVKSNMTKAQKKALSNFGNTKDIASAAANNARRGQRFVAGNTKRLESMADVYAKQGDTASAQLAKQLGQKKGITSSPTLGTDLSYRRNLGKVFGTKDRTGISNPTMANKAGDFFAGGIRDTVQGVKSGQSISQSITNAHTDSSGKLRYDRVAGSFMAASAAARVATGGGLYKDRNGSTNVIGVPFI